MIVVKFEMWPFGDQSRAYDLGWIAITNQGVTGKETPHLFSYKYDLKVAGKARGKRREWKRGFVHGFPRKQRNVYDLLFRVLRDVVGPRNSTGSSEESTGAFEEGLVSEKAVPQSQSD